MVRDLYLDQGPRHPYASMGEDTFPEFEGIDPKEAIVAYAGRFAGQVYVLGGLLRRFYRDSQSGFTPLGDRYDAFKQIQNRVAAIREDRVPALKALAQQVGVEVETEVFVFRAGNYLSNIGPTSNIGLVDTDEKRRRSFEDGLNLIRITVSNPEN